MIPPVPKMAVQPGVGIEASLTGIGTLALGTFPHSLHSMAVNAVLTLRLAPKRRHIRHGFRPNIQAQETNEDSGTARVDFHW
jgi:hypothetical protein